MDSTLASSSTSPIDPSAIDAAVRFIRTVGGLEHARAVLAAHEVSDAIAESKQEASSVSRALGTVDSEEGRLRVLREITSGPYPRYHAMPGVPGLLLRTEADGTQTLGRFVGREFRAIA